MKKWFLFLLIFVAMKAHTQDSLPDFSTKSNRINMTGMKILGGWGAANVVTGGIGWATAGGSGKYFHQMNTFWGAVNTGVAVFGYRSAQRKLTANLNAAEMIKAQQKTERIFLINAGLDLAYIGTGIYLQNRGNRRNDAKGKGYGSSVIMQGIFLAFFDAAMYAIQRGHGNKGRKFVKSHLL